MGCSSCGSKAKAGVSYPHDAVMPDGSTVTVTSASDERVQRQNAQARMRLQAQAQGYTVTRR